MRARLPLFAVLLLFALVTAGADGCSSDPNIESAKLNIRLGEFDDAIENIDAALATNPDNLDALLLKTETLIKKAEKAPLAQRSEIVPDLQQSLAEAERVAPEDPQVDFWKASSWVFLVNTGRTQLAVEGDGPAMSVPYFEGAVSIAPDSLASQFDLGRAQLLAGNVAGSIEPFEQTIAIDPSYTNAYIFLSRAYIDQDRGDDALSLLERGRSAVPEGEDRDRMEQTYLNALAASGQTERAISEFESQVSNYPDDPTIRYNYGTLLLQSERYTEAIEQFAAAAALDPTNTDTQYNLGVTYLREAGRVETEAGTLPLGEEERYNALIAERDTFLDNAVSALEAARENAAENRVATVCDALFKVYGAMGDTEAAAEAAECAGHDMN